MRVDLLRSPDELVPHGGCQRSLDVRLRWKREAPADVLRVGAELARVRAPGGQGARSGSPPPRCAKTTVLGLESSLERLLDVLAKGTRTRRYRLPREIGELLRAVRMAARELEQPLCARSRERLPRSTESARRGRWCERVWRNRADLGLLALRQNGSFSSLKIRSIRCLRLPR